MTRTYDTAIVTPDDAEPFPWFAFGAWTVFWVGFAFGDGLAHRKGRTTLSKLAKRLGRLDTKAGKLVFTAVYVGGAAALHQHLVGGQR